MSTIAYTVADSGTMLRRNLLHMVRYPGLTVFTVGVPVIALLLFVFVFGGTLGAGLPGVAAGAGIGAYLAYVVPGMVVLTIAGTAGGTATTVSMDMTEGIVARFRSMDISRAAVLTGHVLGNVIQGLIAVTLVFVVALAVGFRPTGDPLGWLGALGIVVATLFAVTWLGVGMGMAAKSVETASNLPLILTLLPFLGSGFVPTDTMPDAVRVFAEYQPFTPIVETFRALLMGTPVGAEGLAAVGWLIAITAAGYAWSLALYRRKSVR